MLHFRVREQVLKQVERRGVEPLQIVEEQRQWMFRSCEDVDEAPEHKLKSILSVLWWKIRNGWLRADYELQFGDEVNNERPIRVQRLPKALAPTLELGLAPAQQPADQALKGLRQRRIGNVALVLIEFAGGEKAARRHQRLVQLIDDCGLADAGVARDQHQLRPAAGDDAVEGGKQGLDLALSPVEFLRDQQPV